MADTRELILDAAAHVLRSRGLAKTTTKEIAKAAGYSEATLYKHFTDKEDLFLQVMRHRLPPLTNRLFELPELAGTGTVAGHLEQLCRHAIAFYGQSMPMAASLLSEPTLLARHRERLAVEGAGPHVPVEQLAKYLDAERRLGRLNADVDPDAAASLLLGACFQQAFLATFRGTPPPTDDATVSALVTTLMAGLYAR
jgi:AcrR family transcriptional regulator